MRWLWYKAGKFWRQATAGALSPEAEAAVRAQLTAAEYDLFGRYGHGDQWHGYRVMQALREAGQTHPALLKAALLHDVGKTRVRYTAVQRSYVTVFKRLWPRRVREWAALPREGLRPWQWSFLVQAHHPQWGAEMAAEVGCGDTAVALIRRHQDPLGEVCTAEDELLAHLQWADNQN